MKQERWIVGILERDGEKWILTTPYGSTPFSRAYQTKHFNMNQLGQKIAGILHRNLIVNPKFLEY